MFFKKNQHRAEKNINYDVTYENLAIPEVHTKAGMNEEEAEEKQDAITYESVAIPEIHIRKNKDK